MTTKKQAVPEALLPDLLANDRQPEGLNGENGRLMQRAKLLVEKTPGAG